MDTYTVTFFGHRELSDTFEIERKLENLLRKIIRSKEYVEFLVGRDGLFDEIATSAVKRISVECDLGNTALVLVLPYPRAEFSKNERSFLEFYDEVEICAESSEAHYKSAIQIRNRSMISRSDLVICAVEKNYGGAFQSMRFAEREGKRVVNLIEGEDLL